VCMRAVSVTRISIFASVLQYRMVSAVSFCAREKEACFASNHNEKAETEDCAAQRGGGPAVYKRPFTAMWVCISVVSSYFSGGGCLLVS